MHNMIIVQNNEEKEFGSEAVGKTQEALDDLGAMHRVYLCRKPSAPPFLKGGRGGDFNNIRGTI